MTLILLLTSTMISIASLMFITVNPLSMGILILLMAITLTIIYASMMSSWLAFLIFLIYVSGMLVMFAYFVSLTPNQHINSSMLIPGLATMMTMMMLMFLFNMWPKPNSSFYKFINIFYTSNNTYMLILLALILLYAMIVVVKVVTNIKGPLRPFF